MIRIKPINLLPPNVWEWPPEAHPPWCAWPCSRGCKATAAITIWRMQVTWVVEHVDPYTGAPLKTTSIFGWANDYFMDQYGCRSTGPPDYTESTRSIFVQFSTGLLSGQVSHAWALLKPHLLRAGAEEPGTIRMLPTIEAILKQLLHAQGILQL